MSNYFSSQYPLKLLIFQVNRTVNVQEIVELLEKSVKEVQESAKVNCDDSNRVGSVNFVSLA